MKPRSTQPIKLGKLLAGLAEIDSAWDREVWGLSLDSRDTRPGDLFLACIGTRSRGHDYIMQAVRSGAVAVAFDTDAELPNPEHGGASAVGVPLIGVQALGKRVGSIAGRFYGHPSQDLYVVGITGTNGKTSCAHFLAQALAHDRPCGVIGTVGYGLYPKGEQALLRRQAATHTTPDPVSLQRVLAELRDQKARHVVMEVSSHALVQDRVAGVGVELAVFTNLSRDHLDYHGDMESYAAAKERLFQRPGLKQAVINTDDLYGRRYLSALPDAVQGLSYGLARARGSPQLWGDKLELSATGLRLDVHTPWGQGTIESRLLGHFNALNLLAVLGTLLLMGVPLADALNRLSRVSSVDGRMQTFRAGTDRPLVVVDYAHTPDALDQVLRALRRHCQGRLWCVFGCGGERDAGKRPLMGVTAEGLADQVIVTDDNPRHEDGDVIVQAILAGMRAPQKAWVERNRKCAIALAIREARAGDVVLIAGKGHESYQQVGDQRLPFSDRAQVERLGFGTGGGVLWCA
jgi:UDP-N-acetylmuramoyl-L-alanyl-D-glutamate--2,6-diaminopimelate ligase